MKKYIILVIILIVCWLGFSYRRGLYVLRGETLVTDAYYGSLLDVKNDVEEGADLNYVLYLSDEERQYFNQDFNALHAAASGGDIKVLQYLLQEGMNINQATLRGWTPLFIAARDGNAAAVKFLIYKKANLNAQTDLGATPLMMVVTQPYPDEKTRIELLAYMLKRGADLSLKDHYGHDARYYAQQVGDKDVLELLAQWSVQ